MSERHMTDRLGSPEHSHLTGRPPDGVVRNVIATATVAGLCALLVATAAVLLQPRHAAHLQAARQASMARLIESIPQLQSIVLSSTADSLQSRIVELDTGCFVAGMDADAFDARKALEEPSQSRELSAADGDVTMMPSRRAHFAKVDLLYDRERLQMAILPVSGPGYQSTLHAWLVLAADLNTIVALAISEQGETPGIGSRIENPQWQQSWSGKQILDENDQVAIRVVRNADGSPNQVDGISGATRTSQGVSNMVRFWMSDLGFGPLLQHLRRGDPC
ncbi:MAG: NADH:ubiquinone reductase (Na(+)-transporting) subunit C [Granulosicoccus sp.]|nr:NADH:ubiquinone reductase (Na(+)-transporting) subunit C [Granulosicoccus sp.]